jgi:hypothetical protein
MLSALTLSFDFLLVSGLLVDGSSVSTSDPTSDARLQQNLNELDSLLVNLHEAQKAGFGTDQGIRCYDKH